VKSDSDLFEVVTALAPAAAVLLLAYLARDKTGACAPEPATVAAGGAADDAVSDSAGVQREADASERELIEKLRKGTANEQDVRAFAILMWRRAHVVRRPM
jgi:hypothetical protein